MGTKGGPGSIVPFDAKHLVARLTRAAEKLGIGPVDPREIEHLVGVVTRCSALLGDVYTDDRLRAILGQDPRRLAALVAAPWFRLPVTGDLASLVGRIRRLPDEVRTVGDKALFDLAITGLHRVHGVDLEELGPRAYLLAAEVLELLADDARLREHFLANRFGGRIKLEEEVEFLRRCSERFDLYSRLLREAGGDPEAAIPSLLVPPDIRGVLAAGEEDAREEVPEETEETGPVPGRPIFSEDLERTELLAAYERLLLFASLDLEELRSRLAEIVIDQEEAIATLVDDFALYAVGTQPLSRPASYFLVGPTGVGKNYLVETLVHLLEEQWGIEVPFMTIEGPNYTYPSDINELRGATRGFIRSDEPGLLTQFHEKAAGAPVSVLLVDEVEKAHPQLRRFFLSILDRGVTTDAHGNELHFAGTLVFFTSNIGYKDRDATTRPIGFGGEELAEAAWRAELSRSLRKTLSPEFINRVKIVRFRHLPRASAERILDLEFQKIARRYRELHRIEIELTPAARELFLERGYSREYGARHLASMLQRTCNVEIGKMIRRDEERAAAAPDRGELLEMLRELKENERPLDLAEIDRRIRRAARARVPYRKIVVDARDGEFVYRAGGEEAER